MSGHALRRIAEMLTACGTDAGVLPSTTLYNEGWMLRLVLDWFADHPGMDHPLAFAAGAKWYSEVLLPSQFRARTRGDRLAESWTHADGTIGHVRVRPGRGDVMLEPGASQFVVAEAKMFSGLSAGTKRATTFDQAARNVACVAEVLHQARRTPDSFRCLSFVVLAPEEQVARGVFAQPCALDSIEARVRERAAAYGGDKDVWVRESFLPVLERIGLHILTWEDVIAKISATDSIAGGELADFLTRCIKANRRPAAT